MIHSYSLEVHIYKRNFMIAQEPEREMTPEEETCLELFMDWEVHDNLRNLIYMSVHSLNASSSLIYRSNPFTS